MISESHREEVVEEESEEENERAVEESNERASDDGAHSCTSVRRVRVVARAFQLCSRTRTIHQTHCQ